ncbi:MAG: S49 family peptidase [Martelella sp.]|uniref:S49 family peptidase n=1 Tax=Martelella sp. TaxID=1969699 RepID=UPI003241F2D1
MNYPEIASRMFNTPLMLQPAKAETIARAFGPRVLGLDDANGRQMGIVGERLREEVDWYGEKTYRGAHRVRDQIGLIEIEGSLINKGKWIGKSCGMTTYEAISIQADDCRTDDAIKGAIVEIDSFGGEVTGAFDCAEKLFELSAVKPTIAVLTDHACSAGYLLASACQQIIVPASGLCGSIGVVSLHVDVSGWLKKEGLNVTILKAGAHKADLNPYEAIPEDVLARELAELEEMRVEFAATVARYRAGRLSTEQALATEAGVYRGEKAVEAGLADAVARPSQVLDAFEAQLGLSA